MSWRLVEADGSGLTLLGALGFVIATGLAGAVAGLVAMWLQR